MSEDDEGRGWRSRKLWVFISCTFSAVTLNVLGLFNTEIGTFLLIAPIAYGVINTVHANKVLERSGLIDGGSEDSV